MPAGGQIASKNRSANPTPCRAGWAKETIVVIGNAHAEHVAVIGKHRGLAGKRDCRIAAVGHPINERHAASNPCSQRTKIKVHCPVAISAHVNGGSVQTGDSNCQVAFERLIKECSAVVHCSVESRQESGRGSLHAKRLRNHVVGTSATAPESDCAVYYVVGVPVLRRPELVRWFGTGDSTKDLV